jgi:hypothetical protein
MKKSAKNEVYINKVSDFLQTNGFVETGMNFSFEADIEISNEDITRNIKSQVRVITMPGISAVHIYETAGQSFSFPEMYNTSHDHFEYLAGGPLTISNVMNGLKVSISPCWN